MIPPPHALVEMVDVGKEDVGSWGGGWRLYWAWGRILRFNASYEVNVAGTLGSLLMEAKGCGEVSAA